MATLDITQWATNPSPRQVDEGGSSLGALFGPRSFGPNTWHPQNLWLRTTASTSEEDETVIRHDEVTLKAISMTPGRVKLALTDRQAEQIVRIVGGR